VGAVGALVAPGGTGKTMFALGLAMELACGVHRLRQAFGLAAKVLCAPQSVAMVVAEESAPEMHRRLWSVLGAMTPARGKALRTRDEMVELFLANLSIYPIAGRRRLRLDGEGPVEDIRALSSAAHGRRLLVLDPLRQIHGADENCSWAMTDIVQKLHTLATRNSCAVLVCHHASKLSTLSGSGHQATASRGAGAFTDAVRWQLNLSDVDDGLARRHQLRESERHQHVRLDLAKSNYRERTEPALLRREAGGALNVKLL